jgi:hypothetical protein
MANLRKELPALNTIDADFIVVTGEENNQVRNLPAKLEDVKFLRHKKAESNPQYLQEFSEDIKLDIELGLQNQFEMDQAKVLKKDIDILTSSNNYFQVTPKLLNKLFKIGALRSNCILHNLIESIVESILGIRRPLIFSITFAIFGMLTLIVGNHDSFILFLAMISLIVLDVIFFCLVFASLVNPAFGTVDFKFEFMKINLVMEDIKQTKILLPRIAKLKMKEAQDSELFEAFTIAYPEFKIEEKIFKPKFKFDPVILGVTKDSRMYMICWWDIKKDIDKVRENIRLFKKFKI